MSQVVVTCEHARRDLPPRAGLGVGSHHLDTHIAWDPGALEVAAQLALALGAPLLAGQWSRLLVDLHRRPEHPGAVPVESFGVSLSGNRDLRPEARQRRLAAFHAPWRRWLAAEVQRAVEAGGCLHLSIHSFDPRLHDGRRRDLDVGLLFDPDRPAEAAWAPRLARPLTAAGLRVAFNAPYAGTDEGTTTWLREAHPDPSYAGVEVELRQGLRPAVLERIAAALAGVARGA